MTTRPRRLEALRRLVLEDWAHRAETPATGRGDQGVAPPIVAVGLGGQNRQPVAWAGTPQSVPAARAFLAEHIDDGIPVMAGGGVATTASSAVAPRHLKPELVAGGWMGVRPSRKGDYAGVTTAMVFATRDNEAVSHALTVAHAVPADGFDAPARELVLHDRAMRRPVFEFQAFRQLTTQPDQLGNPFDAALLRPHPNAMCAYRPNYALGVGGVVGVADANLGDIVTTSGGVTGVTRARVTEVMVTALVQFRWPTPTRGMFVMSDCVAVANRDLTAGASFGKDGDSGSPMLVKGEGGYRLAGILFAGGRKRVLYCPARPVLDAFRSQVEAPA